MKDLKKGDLVCYTKAFLRSTSWYTNVPIDGKIIDDSDQEFPVVRWCDREEPVRVHCKNLILKGRLHLEPA
jgi:hypothetical protein